MTGRAKQRCRLLGCTPNDSDVAVLETRHQPQRKGPHSVVTVFPGMLSEFQKTLHAELDILVGHALGDRSLVQTFLSLAVTLSPRSWICRFGPRFLFPQENRTEAGGC